MPPKRAPVRLPFPTGGLFEGMSYEDQPRGTSVDVQNVRAFPATSTEPGSGNSKASGRGRGGQRPGLTKYVTAAHTASTSIQNISQATFSETPVIGRGDSLMAVTSGASYLLVDNLGAQTGSSAGADAETFNLATWGPDGFGYVATVDGTPKLILRKVNREGTESWDWSDDNSPVVDVGSATRQVRGMAVWGNTLYVWMKNIDGVNGECIYRVNTSDGKIRDTTSGNGTEADLWIRSEDQSTGNYVDFYPSTGYTAQVNNLMAASNGVLGLLCINDSGGTAATTSVTGNINWNTSAADFKTAFVALSHIVSADVDVTGGPLNTDPVYVEWKTKYATQDVAEINQTASLTGGSLTISLDQQGNADQNAKIKFSSTATGGTFTLTHNGRLSIQYISVERGKQILCTELMTYEPASTVSDRNHELDIAADEFGAFYTVCRNSNDGSTFTHAITKNNIAGVEQWQNENTGSTRSITYDPVNQRVGAVGGSVLGGGKSFATINSVTGAKINDQDPYGNSPESISIWNCIRSDEEGGFRLFRNNASNNVARLTKATVPVEDWISSLGGAAQLGSACASAYAYDPANRVGYRVTRQIAIAGGVVKEFDTNTWYTVSSGGDIGAPAFNPGRPVIFSAQMGKKLFFADGVTEKYYDASDNSIKTWTASDGTLPKDSLGRRPTLIENWRSRMVTAGVVGDPQEWYMSKQGDPDDWDYAPGTVTVTQAVSGANIPAGKAPDVIKTIIPISQDILVFGCDHSIWMMMGDPMMGGRIHNMTDGLGMPWGRPWAIDTRGNFYFFGTRGGVYKSRAMEPLVKLSERSIEERLSVIDLDSNLIRMAWNEREQGLHVFITALDGYTQGTHYFWDSRNESWWIDKFDKQTNNIFTHDPKAVHVFDGDDPDDRSMLLGGWDGIVRKWDVAASDDDGTATDSYAYLGPLVPPTMGLVRMQELRMIAGKGSSNVTATIYRGDNAEDAYNSTAFYTSTFVAGRNVAERKKAMGGGLYIKIGNNSAGQKWTFERAEVEIELTGRKFARSF